MTNNNGKFLVGNTRGNNVIQFDLLTGQSLGEFIAPNLGGLTDPDTLLFGPDINGDRVSDLYISSGTNLANSAILAFDGKTGSFIRSLVSDNPSTETNETNGLIRPYGIAFGNDGNLYVSSFLTDQILRYNATTGAFVDVFAQGNGLAGGLNGPNGLLFINDSLFVTTQGSVASINQTTGAAFPDFSAGLPSQVLRYDSLTAGSTPTVFATPTPSPDSFGFVSLLGLALGEDGDLYVSDFANDIRRYDLESGNLVDTLSTNYTTNTSPSSNFIGNLAFAPNGDLLVTGFNTSAPNQGAVLSYESFNSSPENPFAALVIPSEELVRPIGLTLFPTESNLASVGTTGDDLVIAGQDLVAIQDIVFTGAGNDAVDLAFSPIATKNRIDLGSGNDVIIASKNDRLFGGSGNDEFDARDGQGGNRMSGGAGDDTFFLGFGDRALGGDGVDRFFVSEGGGNLLSGGAGADQFWIFNGDIAQSANTIADFQIGTDVIGFQGASFGFADLVRTGNNIAVGNSIIATFTGVDTANLTISSFVFA
ncbi:MAG: hypothetical protein DCE90_01980 [Pseudanabaena sp.]|nr:MAG: hypothetical protein DCE90_01980 [Pseudanabaena sp.]